ncbi:hypothetical protein LXL04_000653 [Taraxacum kok-saghyz]
MKETQGFTWKTQIGKNHGWRKPRTNSLYFESVTNIGVRLQKRERRSGTVLEHKPKMNDIDTQRDNDKRVWVDDILGWNQ